MLAEQMLLSRTFSLRLFFDEFKELFAVDENEIEISIVVLGEQPKSDFVVQTILITIKRCTFWQS